MNTATLSFIDYDAKYLETCLALFDENCPMYFAKNERQDYRIFLEMCPKDYFVGLIGLDAVAAFGVTVQHSLSRARLSWILVSPKFKGRCIGTNMMEHVKRFCLSRNVSCIDIAASHLSCSFFAKFGAKEVKNTPNGWGEGMHKIDMLLKIQ